MNDRTREALLSEIYAAPDEDAPRHVYADYLLQQSDPLGHFISLQMVHKSEKMTKEELHILIHHRFDWHRARGEFARIVSDVGLAYRRGFPSHIHMDETQTGIFRTREWSTIETIHTESVDASFFLESHLAHLRAIEIAALEVPWDLLADLLTQSADQRYLWLDLKVITPQFECALQRSIGQPWQVRTSARTPPLHASLGAGLRRLPRALVQNIEAEECAIEERARSHAQAEAARLRAIEQAVEPLVQCRCGGRIDRLQVWVWPDILTEARERGDFTVEHMDMPDFRASPLIWVETPPGAPRLLDWPDRRALLHKHCRSCDEWSWIPWDQPGGVK
jgi:uncharacterized protein (TIGR02996 family)